MKTKTCPSPEVESPECDCCHRKMCPHDIRYFAGGKYCVGCMEYAEANMEEIEEP